MSFEPAFSNHNQTFVPFWGEPSAPLELPTTGFIDPPPPPFGGPGQLLSMQQIYYIIPFSLVEELPQFIQNVSSIIGKYLWVKTEPMPMEPLDPKTINASLIDKNSILAYHPPSHPTTVLQAYPSIHTSSDTANFFKYVGAAFFAGGIGAITVEDNPKINTRHAIFCVLGAIFFIIGMVLDSKFKKHQDAERERAIQDVNSAAQEKVTAAEEKVRNVLNIVLEIKALSSLGITLQTDIENLLPDYTSNLLEHITTMETTYRPGFREEIKEKVQQLALEQLQHLLKLLQHGNKIIEERDPRVLTSEEREVLEELITSSTNWFEFVHSETGHLSEEDITEKAFTQNTMLMEKYNAF